jgi:hypothetical protein
MARRCVGDPSFRPADPDPQDQITFSITGGNDDGVFKIALCRGQLRVALDVLDYYVGPQQYNLTITVTDDGLPAPLTASAFFIINVVRGCSIVVSSQRFPHLPLHPSLCRPPLASCLDLRVISPHLPLRCPHRPPPPPLPTVPPVNPSSCT